MFEKGRKAGTVRFSLATEPSASKVLLAGDFNNWRPKAMRKQKNGTFALTIPLLAGTYEYKFVVADEWVIDPDNNAWAVNTFGTLNSIAQI